MNKVRKSDNGRIILEPRELKVPDSISEMTLKEMDEAVDNFDKGNVSQEVDLSDFQEKNGICSMNSNY